MVFKLFSRYSSHTISSRVMEESCVLLYGRRGEETKLVPHYRLRERRSEMNVSHCSFPKDSMWRNLDTAGSSVITFMSDYFHVKCEEITSFF